MYANSTRCIVQVDLREARVEGSSAERRGESESKVERSRPLMISMSGRRRRRSQISVGEAKLVCETHPCVDSSLLEKALSAASPFSPCAASGAISEY